MRIGVIANLQIANSAYRALAIQEIAARGHDVQVIPSDRLDRVDGGYDVVHVYRDHAAPIRQLVKRLRGDGTAITWDNDDDYSSAELEGVRGAISRGGAYAQRIRADMGKMVELAQLVTTPSAVLADSYRKAGARDVEVVENYLPAYYVPRPRPRGDDGVTIGWVACEEHFYDLRQLDIGGTLQRLLARHPRLRVLSIGLDLRFEHERYRHVPTVQHGELATALAGLDVAIAPLMDIPFNRARSNVKLKEYAGAGVAWLASPVGPYAGFGARQGGQLVPADGWDEALERLIARPRERRRLARRGRRWAQGQTVASNLDRWEQALARAVAAGRR